MDSKEEGREGGGGGGNLVERGGITTESDRGEEGFHGVPWEALLWSSSLPKME